MKVINKIPNLYQDDKDYLIKKNQAIKELTEKYKREGKCVDIILHVFQNPYEITKSFVEYVEVIHDLVFLDNGNHAYNWTTRQCTYMNLDDTIKIIDSMIRTRQKDEIKTFLNYNMKWQYINLYLLLTESSSDKKK